MTDLREVIAAAVAADEAGDRAGAARLWRVVVAVLPAAAGLIAGLAGTLDDRAGCRWFARAAALEPDQTLFPLAAANLSRRLGQAQAAAGWVRRALTLAPDNPLAAGDLAVCETECRHPDRAADWAGRALALTPDDPARLIAAADHTLALGDFAATEAIAARLNRRLPEWVASAPDWEPLGQMIYLGPYLGFGAGLRRRIGARASALMAAEAGGQVLAPATPRRSDAPLRVGMVSADFGNRPMGQVVCAALEALDRRKIDLRLYALVDRSADPGALPQRLRACASAFVDLSTADAAAAARRIADDTPDLLIDLHGFMQHGRPALFARRPAPVQAYWIGHHGGGLGLDHIDYAIADRTALTPAARADLTEAVVWLPHCYHPAERPAVPDLTLDRADFGLPRQGVVFCAFNNPQKIDRATFAAWMAILAAVPDAVLWLSNPQRLTGLEDNLRAAAEGAGIAGGRLVFAGFAADKGIHLARHRLADLFLDAFPATASTTALDALGAGLPVLTRAGAGVAQRIAASMVTTAGLADALVVADADVFVARAIDLARDAATLHRLKAAVAQAVATTPLFDAVLFARGLEAAFAAMVARSRAGLAPADIELS